MSQDCAEGLAHGPQTINVSNLIQELVEIIEKKENPDYELELKRMLDHFIKLGYDVGDITFQKVATVDYKYPEDDEKKEQLPQFQLYFTLEAATPEGALMNNRCGNTIYHKLINPYNQKRVNQIGAELKKVLLPQ